MSELVTKSVAQEQPGQKIETRTAAQRVAGFTVVVTDGRLRTGQILAEIAERNRVFRLQGIRGLGLSSLPRGPTKCSR